MKSLEVLNKSINELKIEESVLIKLNSISIYKIEDLWKVSSKYLKDNKFTNTDITNIKIKLQLLGLDLDKKIY